MGKRFCPNIRDDNSFIILHGKLKVKSHACMLGSKNRPHHFQGPGQNEMQGSILKK